MARNATLGDNLVDQLVPLADDLRGSFYPAFGTRQYRVFIVRRRWSGAERGQGVATVVNEVEIDPIPEVRFGGGRFASQPAGFEDSDVAVLREVSLTFSEAELTGKPTLKTEEFYYRIVEGHGQKSAPRYYMLDGIPLGDREKTIGWIVPLRRVEIQE